MSTAFLLALSVLLPRTLAELSLDFNSHMITPDLAVGCTSLRLPTSLCSSCPMKSFDEEGNFQQRLDAFELSAPACQAALTRYVRLNPCDTVRAAQIADQDDPDNSRNLEIFMYAVCETCCDCIPIGATVDEYDQRAEDRKLLTPLRGNCVMHYLFDTCKILPNVSDVARPKNNNFLGVEKPVCDIIKEWRTRGFGRDWQLDPAVEALPRGARRYLARTIKFMGCRKKSIWQSCIPMEQARGRV